MGHLDRLLLVGLTVTSMACGGGGGSESGNLNDTSNTGVDNTTSTDQIADTTTPVDDSVQDLSAQFSSYLKSLTDNHILPRYQALSASAEQLHSSTQNFCSLETKSADDVQVLQQQWSTLNDSWQRIQWLQTGPVEDLNRHLKLQFWPDTNNAVTRGLDSLLLNPATITADIVRTTNVGAQGIPALEVLLFQQPDTLVTGLETDKRCEMVTAISDNVRTITTDIYNDWAPASGNFAEQFVTGSVSFSSTQDAVEDIVNDWFVHFEKLKDDKLTYPLTDAAPGDAAIVEFQYSKQSLESVAANIATIKEVYTAGNDYGFNTILQEALDLTALNSQIMVLIEQSISGVEAIEGTLVDGIADDQKRLQLTDLIAQLKELRGLMRQGIIQSMDLNLGFNSTDGD
jgi:hypothetical protein